MPRKKSKEEPGSAPAPKKFDYSIVNIACEAPAETEARRLASQAGSTDWMKYLGEAQYNVAQAYLLALQARSISQLPK